MSALCLYFGTPGECQNCGGHTRSIDPDTGQQGPFEPDHRYCSEDCYAEAQEFMQRNARWWATDWCPACGFDNHEHAPDCTTLTAGR